MATLSRGITYGATETITNAKLHALVDNGSISGIANADIAADALIDSSKINFTLSDYVTLAGDQTITGTKTFSNTQIFSTPLANTNIAAITQADKVAGSSFYALASCVSGAGKLPLANIPTIDSLLPAQTGNDGKFLTTNGSAASWGSVVGIPPYVVGTNTEATAATERTSNSSVYTKFKEFSPAIRGGTIRVSLELKSVEAGRYVNAKVYINGLATGTELRTASASYVTLTDDVVVSAGDIVQIYCKYESTASAFYIKNAKILCGNPVVPVEVSGL